MMWGWIGCGLATAFAWYLTWVFARAMNGDMPLAGGGTMSMMWMPMGGHSELFTAIFFLAMWECMMVAMMLMSAIPILMISARAARHAGASSALAAVVAAGYFISWLGFGVAVYIGGRLFGAAVMNSPALAHKVPILTGATLIAAGLYQLTPMKNACLRHCRSPLLVMADRWRPDWRAALKTGIHSGNFCVACCWPLMAVQCVLGLMNFPLMIGIATVIAAEKLVPRGAIIAMAAGMAMAIAGAAMIFHAAVFA